METDPYNQCAIDSLIEKPDEDIRNGRQALEWRERLGEDISAHLFFHDLIFVVISYRTYIMGDLALSA
jgi:hypothetical protein